MYPLLRTKFTEDFYKNFIKSTVIIFIFFSELLYATEVKPIIIYRSLWESPFTDSSSGDSIIAEFNAFHQSLYSDCITRITALPKGSAGTCTNRQASNNRAVGSHTISGSPAEYNQDVVTTTSNKEPSTGSISSVTIQGIGKIFNVVWDCPTGTISSGSMDNRSCVIKQEVPNQCAVEGNPINYLTGEKQEEVIDYLSNKGLVIKRRYLNQSQGWDLERENRLFDFTDRFSNTTGISKKKCNGLIHVYKLKKHNTTTADPSDRIDVYHGFCLLYVKQNDNVPSIVLSSADGTHHDFYQSGGYFYSSFFPARLEAISPENSEGHAWVLRFKNGKQEFYDRRGLLKKSFENSNNYVLYSYDEDRLIGKSNLHGETITYEYDSNKNLIRINLPDSKFINYQYISSTDNISLLQSVTNSNGSVKEYLYENSNFPYALTGVIDENGTRYASWSYDAQGRAISSEHQGGVNFFEFDYSQPNKTTVTNPLNKKTTYNYTVINDRKLVTRVDGVASPNCDAANKLYEYYPDGLVKSKTDWKGIKTTYTYNSAGQEISRTEAFGTVEARTITTEWHSALFLKTKITEPKKETTFSYDSNGRLLSQSFRSLNN